MTQDKKYKLIKHREFDLAYGSEYIWYTLHEYRKGLFRKIKWYPVKAYQFDFSGGAKYPVSGGLNWAKAIAKELNIKVPKNV